MTYKFLKMEGNTISKNCASKKYVVQFLLGFVTNTILKISQKSKVFENQNKYEPIVFHLKAPL